MKYLIAACALLFVVGVGHAAQPHYFVEVSATQTNTNTDINTNLGQDAHTVIIINDGANEVFIDFEDGVATTSDMRLDPTDPPFAITSGNGAYPISNVGLICSTGETATVRIYAFPSK